MKSPSYLAKAKSGELSRIRKKLVQILEKCSLCPRECNVNRLADEKGFCRTGRKARVASFNVHFGEESPLVGTYGSGTIFISSCNLLCLFCQNYDISHLGQGIEVEPEQIGAMMIELQERGCHNINFVSPTHVVPQLLEALEYGLEAGLNIPLVYNSSGYDKAGILKYLEGIFDIYMPDFKFWDNQWADRLCQAPDYKDVAVEAIREMHRQVGDLVLDQSGIALRGLLIRHLVMPGGIAGTADIVRFIAEEISVNTYVNVMEQYRPCGRAHEERVINRLLTGTEFNEAINTAREAGLLRLDSRDRFRLVLGR
jgi:putative pyruvate formate lyase activating enzyme